MMHAARLRRAFTLTELLVAIAIIAVLGGLAAVAVKGISDDARISTGLNIVTSSLDNARALAMKDNVVVAVAFRARWDPSKPREPQQTEVVIARWSGETWLITDAFNPARDLVIDRFVPYPDVAVRPLPAGIKVAGPFYDRTEGNSMWDDVWQTQTEFAAIASGGEEPGRLFAVVFGPDGTLMGFNPRSNAGEIFVDFDSDSFQDSSAADPLFPDGNNYWEYDHPLDETRVNIVKFLAVYDDREARERKTTDWAVFNNYKQELSGPQGYIARNGRRIHFNRYSGVAMTMEDR